MLYDLKTRLGIDELATCSALTASDSRAQHLNALSKLEKILGVRCFESLAEFDLPQQPVGFEPRLRGSGIRAALQLRDGAIVAISAVRAARGPRALETIAQEDFV